MPKDYDGPMETVRQTEIPEAIGNLQIATSKQGELFAKLLDRLAPVLRTDAEKSVDPAPRPSKPAQTIHGRQLIDLIEVVDSHNNSLNEILRRLEV